MHCCLRLLAVVAALLIAGTAWAQEQPKVWLGAELQDVSKDEADKLGWDVPRGAKVTAPVPTWSLLRCCLDREADHGDGASSQHTIPS